MPALRTAVTVVLVVVAVSLQVGLLSYVSVGGVVPDLVLLVVVGVALVHGPRHAAVLGLLAGLVLDLAPPADHTAGRWALSLVIVGYLSGMVRGEARTGAVAAVAAVAASVFVGASVFGLSGLVVGDPGVSVPRVLEVLPMQVLLDVAVAVVVLPVVFKLSRARQPADRWARA